MRKKILGLYDPYLDVLGGGEKHILSIIKILENEYEIHIFWDEDLSNQLSSRLNIKFKNQPIFKKNIFKSKKNIIEKLKILKNYEYFFYITDGSYFLSTAKKNFVFCMIPDKYLYQMNILNRIKTSNFKFISNSKFTKDWLVKWNIKSDVIYPQIDDVFIKSSLNSLKKEKIILSVGRFFKHLHSKRQDLLISCFEDLKKKDNRFSDYKLILAGGVKEEDKKYFSLLEDGYKKDKSIIFKPNISFSMLLELYKKSEFFWHIAGFGIDEEKHPELTEHLGMAPLEAMAMGCVTFVYNAGGIKETIKDQENGFLFNTIEELINKSIKVSRNPLLQNMIKNKAKKSIIKNFSFDSFNKTVNRVVIGKN